MDILEFVDLTMTDVEQRLQTFRNEWGFGQETMRELDLQNAQMHFHFDRPIGPKGRTLISRHIQMVGAFDKAKKVFVWSWAELFPNAALPSNIRSHAIAAKEFGERHGLPIYHKPKSSCTAEDAWEFACIAACLGKAEAAMVHDLSDEGVQLYLTIEYDRGDDTVDLAL